MSTKNAANLEDANFGSSTELSLNWDEQFQNAECNPL